MTHSSNKVKRRKTLSYASAGVNRVERADSRKQLSLFLKNQSRDYAGGKPVELPFGLVFPSHKDGGYYLDLQIEGVGTKTLLAELSGNYETIGIDGVAMAVNDTIRSGARPILVSDAIHIAKSDAKKISSIIRGVSSASNEAGAVVASGETGNVAEILHSKIRRGTEPFDLFVTSVGLVQAGRIIRGKIAAGDVVLGIESSGIHSNGLTLARKVLLKQWGGMFDQDEIPSGLERSVMLELLTPTRIYAKPLLRVLESSKVKAAVHVTGDGFGKFSRLLEFNQELTGMATHKLGFRFAALGDPPPIFSVIQDSSKRMGTPISDVEMFRTFNMGYGFAVIVSREDAENSLDLLNRYYPTRVIGKVTLEDRIIVENAGTRGRSILI